MSLLAETTRKSLALENSAPADCDMDLPPFLDPFHPESLKARVVTGSDVFTSSDNRTQNSTPVGISAADPWTSAAAEDRSTLQTDSQAHATSHVITAGGGFEDNFVPRSVTSSAVHKQSNCDDLDPLDPGLDEIDINFDSCDVDEVFKTVSGRVVFQILLRLLLYIVYIYSCLSYTIHVHTCACVCTCTSTC